MPRGTSAMYTLTIVIFISQFTNSYALAGMASAAFVISQTLYSPQIARLINRLGQRKIMLPVSILCNFFSTITNFNNQPTSNFYILCSTLAEDTIGSYNTLIALTA